MMIRHASHWLTGLRIAGLAYFLLLIGLYILAVPLRLAELSTIMPEGQMAVRQLSFADAAMLAEFDLSMRFYGVYNLTYELIIPVIFLSFALVLFLHQTDEQNQADESMTLLVAWMLMLLGSTLLATLPVLKAWGPIWRIFDNSRLGLTHLTMLFFMILFPTGQFVPRWTRWMGVIWVSWIIGWHGGVGVIFIDLYEAEITRLYILPWEVSFYSLSLIAQIQRYRHFSDPIQKQQTKWVIFAAILIVCSYTLITLSGFFNPRVIHALVILPLFYVVTFPMFALSIGIATWRYRLWELDFVVNRTLVYGTLSGLLVLAYILSVALLQGIVQAVTGQSSELVIVASTLVTIALFNPLRRRVQTFIDQRFYRAKLNLQQDFADLATELRTLIEPDILQQTLLQRLSTLLYSRQAAIFLSRADGSFQRTTAHNLADIESIKLPLPKAMRQHLEQGHLVQQTQINQFPWLVPLTLPRSGQKYLIGVLALGPHVSGQELTRDEQALLRVLGQQAGIALHVAQQMLAQQTAVRESEEKYRTILTSIEDGYYEVDMAGNLVFFNEALSRIIGYPADELLGMNYRQFSSQDSVQPMLDTFNTVFETGQSSRGVDWEAIRKDGSRRYVETSISLIRDHLGQPSGFRGIVRDITERRKANIALRESEVRFRTLVDHAPEGIFVYNADANHFIEANENIIALLGYPKERLLQISWVEISPEYQSDEQSSFEKGIVYVQQALMGGAPVFEWTFRHAEGRSIPTEVRLVRLLATDRNLLRASITDISERKQAEAERERLLTELRRLTAVIDTTSDFVAIASLEGQLIYVNPAGLALVGRSAVDVTTLSIADFHPPEVQRLITETIMPAIMDQGVWSGELALQHVDGQQIPVSQVSMLIRNPSGQPIALGAIIRDISTLKQAEIALREREAHTRLIVDTALDAVISMNTTGTIIGWNSQAEMTFGWSHEAAMGQPLADLIIPLAYRDAHDKGLAHYLETGEGPVLNQRIEITALHRDGHEFPIELSIAPVHLDENTIFNAFVRDITERKRQEEAERRLTAYQNSPVGQAETLAETLIAEAEAALLQLYQLTQQASRDPDMVSLISHLPQALHNLGAEILGGLADGFAYLITSQVEAEVLRLGLRTLLTHLATSLTASWTGAEQAVPVYQHCQTALAVENIGQIMTLLPQLGPTSETTANNPFADLINALAELQNLIPAFNAYERVEMAEDKLAYLASAIEQLSRIDRFASAELGGADRPLLQGVVETWLTIITEAMLALQTQAKLSYQLITRFTQQEAVVPVILLIKNEGRGAALNVTISLSSAPAYQRLDETMHLDQLSSGEEQQIIFQVQPATEVEHLRVHFLIQYTDPRGANQVEHFADVVQLFTDAGEFRFIPNPYVVGTPLQPGSALFVGREALIAFIDANLKAAHRNNLVLIGQRRMGKTSLLKQLLDRLDDSYLPVYLDGQMLSLDPGLPTFFLNLGTEIAFALEDRGLVLEPPDYDTFEQNPGGVFEHQFLPKVRAAIGDRHLLILFDEFEELDAAVQRGHLDQAIFGFLRHLMQHASNTSLIFCGTRRLEALASDYWSVLFNTSLYQHVGYLSQAEAQQLIQHPVRDFGMRYDDLALDKLWRLTAGHPYFLQLLCHSLVNRHNRTERNYITVADVNVALDEILASGEAHFVFLWTESTMAERYALVSLSRITPLTGRASAAQVIDYLAEQGITLTFQNIHDALHQLHLRDLLAEDTTRTDAYRWQLGLFGLWLARYKSVNRVVELGNEAVLGHQNYRHPDNDFA